MPLDVLVLEGLVKVSNVFNTLCRYSCPELKLETFAKNLHEFHKVFYNTFNWMA